jgi:hypothetical protein
MARINRLRSSALALGVALAASFAAVSVRAQEDGARESVDCIMVNRIDKDLAISARAILFWLKGGEVYRNDLPGNCTILTHGETRLDYLYTTQTARLTRLCDVDSIRLDDQRQSSCELGRFQPITAEEAELLANNPAAAAALAATPAPASNSTVAAQSDFAIKIEAPDTGPQCEAAVTTGYYQANTIARVEGTIQVTGCPVASGTYTIAARVRNEAGETTMLEFQETFASPDNKSFPFKAEYPIGENVELVNVRTRSVRCSCAEQPAQ